MLSSRGSFEKLLLRVSRELYRILAYTPLVLGFAFPSKGVFDRNCTGFLHADLSSLAFASSPGVAFCVLLLAMCAPRLACRC